MNAILPWPAPKPCPGTGSWRRITSSTPNTISGQWARIQIKETGKPLASGTEDYDLTFATWLTDRRSKLIVLSENRPETATPRAARTVAALTD
jgi:hypothetical protein